MEGLTVRQQIAAREGHPEWADLPARAIDAEAWGVDAYFSGRPCKHRHIAPCVRLPVRKCSVCLAAEVEALKAVVVLDRLALATAAGHPEWAELPATSWAARECGSTIYFSQKVCPKGHVAPRHRSNGSCTACYQESRADPDFLKRERERFQSPEYREKDRIRRKHPENQEKDRERQRTPEHRAYSRAYEGHRRALTLKATPRWLTPADHEAMRLIYAESARLTIETGILHHVDHIVPLQSRCPITNKRNATGFHCPANLQVIPASDNLSKNCYFDGGWTLN